MKSFNLTSSDWIPLQNGKLISLFDAFADTTQENLGGTPLEAISILKLLLAIAQSACKVDDYDYEEMTISDFSEKCRLYLTKWKDHFDLYDPIQPFLQFPQLNGFNVESKNLRLYSNHGIGSKVNKGLNHHQFDIEFDDAEIARILLLQQGFCMGGKGVNTSIKLSPTLPSKGVTGCIGTNQGRKGFLHAFMFGENLLTTLFINLLTTEEIDGLKQFRDGLGVAVWEDMPISENCSSADRLSNSLMGRLIPMNRFCLLSDGGIKIIEGIRHQDYSVGLVDPSVTLRSTVKNSGIEYKVIESNVSKQGWRSTDSILSFLDLNDSGLLNIQVKHGLFHAKEKGLEKTALVTLGTQIGFQTGEQYMGGNDDYVHSLIYLNAKQINSEFYSNLKVEWLKLSELVDQVSKGVYAYYKLTGIENKDILSERTNLVTQGLWANISNHYQSLADSCLNNEKNSMENRYSAREKIVSLADQAYESIQPELTKKLQAWVKCKPYLKKYCEMTTHDE